MIKKVINNCLHSKIWQICDARFSCIATAVRTFLCCISHVSHELDKRHFLKAFLMVRKIRKPFLIDIHTLFDYALLKAYCHSIQHHQSFLPFLICMYRKKDGLCIYCKKQYTPPFPLWLELIYILYFLEKRRFPSKSHLPLKSSFLFRVIAHTFLLRNTVLLSVSV